MNQYRVAIAQDAISERAGSIDEQPGMSGGSMAADGKQDELRLGFLTAVDSPEQGYVGGLLVTNQLGRPLEFQCTTPVKPNRTQEILYGPTLESFILAELIGKTLVEKAGVKPHLILTDRAPILELREQVQLPVLLVESKSENAAGSETVVLGRQTLRFHAAHTDDRQVIESRAGRIPDDADLGEPFDRVREALREATQAGAA